MRGLFQFPIAARFIAILGLVGLGADGAMAQSSPQLLFAKLGSTAMVAGPVPTPTSLEPSGPTLANRSSEKLLPIGDFSVVSNIPTSDPITLSSTPNISLLREIMKSSAIDPVRRTRSDVFSTFIVVYNSLSKSLAVRAKSLIQKYAALTPAPVVGIASTYNPYVDGNGSDDKQTASGEPYDPAAWTAAIWIDLREQFGGVRYGKNYRPTFALVESGEKCVIVKINDVGPLGPGRVIDLNERSMRYFDPTQQLGLISDVKVTLLRRDNWTPGPIASERPAIAQ